jgi:hypothetical protein
VYDVLPDNQGVGNVTVNSTTFQVTCGGLSSPRVSATVPEAQNGSTSHDTTTMWTIADLDKDSTLHDSFKVSIIGESLSFLFN